MTVVAKGTDAEGKPTSLEYTANANGKEAPAKGSPAFDTVSMKKADRLTTVSTRKRAGKMVQVVTREVSADGKTMRIQTTGTDEKGKTINNVAIFDKQ